MLGNRYYFAYGSNMDLLQMSERCPRAVLVGTAKLCGYRFIINIRGVASAIPKTSSDVYGVLWNITDDDERSLDEHEGVEWGTYRKLDVDIEIATGKTACALIYIARDGNIGSPRHNYMEKILSAAKQHELPSKYIKELTSWLIDR